MTEERNEQINAAWDTQLSKLRKRSSLFGSTNSNESRGLENDAQSFDQL